MSAARLTGRFAPSPSGPLHFGSLLAAMASCVDARAQGGRWLVRMENIDPPREMPGADAMILRSLEAHGLYWDGEVLYQSSRADQYRAVLADLLSRGLAYRCACSRARLASINHIYDGHCLRHPPPAGAACAIRLRLPDRAEVFNDRILGSQSQRLSDGGDCVIHRKDGLFAYQLAVVVDDIGQGITDVVRGRDILESTGRQLYLTGLLGSQPARYAHIPLALGPDGQKLSKQNHAPALDDATPSANLCQALEALGQQPPADLANEAPDTVLKWAVTYWDIKKIPKETTV